jgi:hypothetical protein
MTVAAGMLVSALVGGTAHGAAFASSTGALLRPDAKLLATPALTSDFGNSVAISRDGETAVIGGETDNGGAGAAWVFTRVGSAWVQQGPKLVATGVGAHSGFGGRFGATVAISAGGSTVLVGNREGTLSGWVFVRSGGSWRELGRRLAPRNAEAEESSQGAIALSGDGRTVVLSGTYTDAQKIARDAAWVFVRSGAGWRQQGPRLTGRGDHSDGFGYSTALSGDGDTLLLGTAGGGYSGAAWVFRRARGRFSQQGTRLPGSGEREGFGESVALSANATTALVGSAPTAGRRAVYVYRRARDGWARGALLLAPREAGSSYYGSHVALSADGRTALIAAPTLADTGVEYLFTHSGNRWRAAGELTSATGLGDDVALADDGDTVLVPPDGDDPHSTAYLYTRAGAQWSEQTPTLMPADESNRDNPGFGRSVALSADGNTALVGEYGAAWIFVRSGEQWTQQGPALRPPGTGGYFGSSVALSGDGNTAIVGDPGEKGPEGTAYVFTRSGEAWTQQGPALTPNDASPPSSQSRGVGEGFGYAVAISADASTALVGDPSEADGTGAAWAFTRGGATWTQQGPKLTGAGELGDAGFGFSVALSADGDTALMGAPDDDDQATTSENLRPGTSGAVWVFTRPIGAWSQDGAKLVIKHSENDLGVAVALSANGQSALLGALGRAWPFAATSSGWSPQGPALSAGTPFGESLSLSADGNTALIGGIPANDCGKYMDDPCGTSGSAWTYTHSSGAWTRQDKLTGRRQLGSSVAISADGTTALIGSPIEDNAQHSLAGGTALVAALYGGGVPPLRRRHRRDLSLQRHAPNQRFRGGDDRRPGTATRLPRRRSGLT